MTIKTHWKLLHKLIWIKKLLMQIIMVWYGARCPVYVCCI